MFDKIAEAFQKVFEAIDECSQEIKHVLEDEAQQNMKLCLFQADKLKENLERARRKAFSSNKEDMRSECIVFLRDFGVREAYKGTEFLIYILLNHKSTEILNLSNLYQELAEVYKIPSNTIRSTLVNALKSVDEEYISPKNSLYTIMRDWEIYKKEKELE